MAGKTFIKCLHKWLLPGLLTVVYLLQQSWWGSSMADLMELRSNPNDLLTAPWSLVTYAFLHSSPIHFGINILVLTTVLIFPHLSEKEIWGVFLTSSVIGGGLFIGLTMNTNAGIMGASAGIAALIALVLNRMFQYHRLWMILLPLVIALDWLSRGLTLSPAFAIHLSGYLVGLLYAIIVRRLEVKNERQRKEEQAMREAANKAEISGYRSLTPEEQNLLTSTIKQ